VTRDEQRFQRIYERHYRAVLAYALRRASSADAHDVVAETFLVAWRRLASVPPSAEELPWLYAVAHRVLANQQRGQRRAHRLTARLSFEPGAAYDETGDTGAVVQALARLRPLDREVLLLQAWEGLSHREVACVFGCSENAVAIRLHRARTRLADELAKDLAPTGHGEGE
jgi:RNA polymerase sigma-70 factor, ECF subfamily